MTGAAFLAAWFAVVAPLAVLLLVTIRRRDRRCAEGVDRATAATGKSRRDCRAAFSADRRAHE